MEKTHLFCKTEESIDVSAQGSDSSTTKMSSRSVESKKYCKISKTTGKKISSESKGLIPEYKKIYETSLFVYREEKSTEVSGSKQFRRKKSVQVQLHSKRTETVTPSSKVSKEKITKKESTSKLPVHKPSVSQPQRTAPIPGRKEPPSNLSLTYYEQMPEEFLKYQELNALSRGCLIFSKVRNGKIYVNDLPVVLHTLKISTNDSEMHQALKTVNIDVNGMLDFTEFLKVMNDISPSTSQDPEFQNALKIFSKVKSGRVAIVDVGAVLQSMDILVNPETLKDVIQHAYEDSSHTMDIGDIIFTLDELQQQYEDISIVDETTSGKRASTIPGLHPQEKKDASLFRMPESITSKKQTVPPQQHPSKTTGNQDEPELRLSKQSSETRQLSSGLISDSLGLQEPQLKIHDSKSKSPSLKSTPSSSKLLDEGETSISARQKLDMRKTSSPLQPTPSISKLLEEGETSISEHQKLDMRKTSSPLQPTPSISKLLEEGETSISERQKLDMRKTSSTVQPTPSRSKLLEEDETSISEHQKLTMRKTSSSLQPVAYKKESTVGTLDNIHEAISKLRGEYISPEELQFALSSVGITLSDDDFHKIVPELTQTEEGKVNLDDFIMAISKDHNFPAYDALNSAIEGINKIQDKYVDYSDLDTFLQNFGLYLPKSEVNKIKELIQADGTKQVNLEEFIDTMLKNTEPFPEHLLLPSAIENLQNLSNDEMEISQLWNTLSSLNSNLKKDEFLEAVKLANIDGDKVQLEEFSKAVKDLRDSYRLKELQKIVSILDSLEGEKIPANNLEDFLRSLGITSFKDEVEEILQSDIVSEDNMASVKECIEALKDTAKFSNFTALKEAIEMLDSIKGSTDKEQYLKELEDLEGLRKEMLPLNLKLPTVSDIKEAADILSQVEDGKIAISDLEHALKCSNPNLTEEDIKEALKHCYVTDDMEVDLKDFLTELKKTSSFKDSGVTQLLVATPQVLKEDLIDVHELKKILSKDDLHSAKAILTEILSHVQEDEDGKITIEEFVNEFANLLKALKSKRVKEMLNTKFDLNNINAASEIKQNLNALGIHPTESDIQRAMENLASSGDVVMLKDIIRELANNDIFSECQRIEDIHNLIDRISEDKVDIKDLLSVLKKLQKPLEEEEGQPGVSPTSEMSDKDRILKDTIDYFTGASTEATPFNNLLKGVKAFDNIRNNKMPADELVSSIMSTGIPISRSTMQEILRQASVNENDEVSLKQVLENLATQKPDPILEDIENALNAVKLMTSDKVKATNLTDSLQDLNIHLKPEDQQLLEEILDVDENGDVSQRAALLALKSNKRLKDFREANEIAKALDKVTSEKIGIDDLKHISKGLGLDVPDKELQDLDAKVSRDEEGNVDLKDWLMKLKETRFRKSSRIQAALKALASIRKNKINSGDLVSILKNIGVALPKRIIEAALKNMSLSEDGKLDIEEFLNHLIKAQLASIPEKEMIDASSVDDVLKNMDITLTDEEKEVLFEHLPAPDDEGIDMEMLIGVVKMLKEKVDITNLSSFLGDMGVELSEEEQRELLSSLPVSAEGKISQLQLVDLIKNLQGGKVDVEKLDSALEKMGMELTSKEFQHLQEHLPVDTDGKVALNILLGEVKRLKKKVQLSTPLMEVPHISASECAAYDQLDDEEIIWEKTF